MNQKVRFNKVCTICGKEYNVIKSRIKSKFCSLKCYWINLHEAEKGRVFGMALLKADKHPYWKGGNNTHSYVKNSIKIHGVNCQQCGSIRHVDTHHIDKNPNNNPLNGSNWMRLCSSCHHKLDGNWKILKRDDLGRFIGI